MTRETLHETAATLAWFALNEYNASERDARQFSRGQRCGYQRALNNMGIYWDLRIRNDQIMVEISDGFTVESASVLIKGMPQ